MSVSKNNIEYESKHVYKYIQKLIYVIIEGNFLLHSLVIVIYNIGIDKSTYCFWYINKNINKAQHLYEQKHTKLERKQTTYSVHV